MQIKNILSKKEKSSPQLVVIAGCAGSGKTSLGELLAKTLGWTYIDKDTLTRSFTDFILEDKGHSRSDRESDLYVNIIKPIEYKITFKVCQENLRLGNSVILTAPFISQIKQYEKWEECLNQYDVKFHNVDIKFIWIKHDIGREYTRIKKRNAERDGYKLEHWEEYSQNMDGIMPDSNYHAYIFENDSNSVDNIYVEDIIKLIKK